MRPEALMYLHLIRFVITMERKEVDFPVIEKGLG